MLGAAVVAAAGVAFWNTAHYGSRESIADAQVPSVKTVAAHVRRSTKRRGVDRGPSAAAFTVKTLEGQRVTVPDGRPTVVFFMSAGCGSCLGGEQQLAQLAETMPARVRWLSLDVAPGYDTPQAVLSAAALTGAHWPQGYATAAILKAYHVTQLDQVAVISGNGRLIYDGALPSSARLSVLLDQAAHT
jgi:thiol-disulfide isomerase/thioredoxin